MGGLLGGIIGAGGGMASGAAQGLAGILATKAARDWEEKMRASAYQTTVKDMVKAGLNPALAYFGGPTGKGSVPPNPIPDIGGMAIDGFNMGVSGAKSVKAQADELAAIKAGRQAAETDAETKRLVQESLVRRPRLENDLLEQNILGAQTERMLKHAQIGETTARTLQTDVNRFLGEAQLPGMRATNIEKEARGYIRGGMSAFDELMQVLKGWNENAAKRR